MVSEAWATARITWVGVVTYMMVSGIPSCICASTGLEKSAPFYPLFCQFWVSHHAFLCHWSSKGCTNFIFTPFSDLFGFPSCICLGSSKRVHHHTPFFATFWVSHHAPACHGNLKKDAPFYPFFSHIFDFPSSVMGARKKKGCTIFPSFCYGCCCIVFQESGELEGVGAEVGRLPDGAVDPPPPSNSTTTTTTTASTSLPPASPVEAATEVMEGEYYPSQYPSFYPLFGSTYTSLHTFLRPPSYC